VVPRWQSGAPIEHNWIARKGSEDFAGLVDYESEFQLGARRFDVGERSNFALMPAARASLEMLLGWGMAWLYATLNLSSAMTPLRRAEAELGLSSVPTAPSGRALSRPTVWRKGSGRLAGQVSGREGLCLGAWEGDACHAPYPQH
jgi:hypothetical protein